MAENVSAFFLEDTFTGGKLLAITPADDAFLPSMGFVYVGGGGDLAVVAAGDCNGIPGDNAITLVAVPTGSLLPIKVCQVLDTGTDATDLVLVR